MKHCSKCDTDKSVEEFSLSLKRGRQFWCKSCVSSYDKARFPKVRALRVKQDAANGRRITELVRKLKSESPCADCGLKFHPAAMDFDHLPGSVKVDGIAQLLQKGWGYERILGEISKCELVCANCHRVRTYNRRLVVHGEA